ncbi:hypothetical protein C7N83_10455 [Neisseria iguanae]|uniref:Uncharacterized protein n=1 Tax=Neisseria iguanae TaxID=90242 RepID=A0A2P7TYF4_9NEIS|nr:hypothetical protein C7N83_10455 [Neisseria iguanae]
MLPRQAELRDKIDLAQSKEEKEALYEELYALQYKKRLAEMVVGAISGSPGSALSQGGLQLAATWMRKQTLDNSRQSPVITDGTTTVGNVEYDSAYFDGVKLGGTRVSVDIICGENIERCKIQSDGSYVYTGGDYVNDKTKESVALPTLKDAIDPKLNGEAGKLYGLTGGFQSKKGSMLGKYTIGSWKDTVVEGFSGTHDYMGGQIWGFYNDKGNATRGLLPPAKYAAEVITVIAIPVSAPFAVSDILSSDIFQAIFR